MTTDSEGNELLKWARRAVEAGLVGERFVSEPPAGAPAWYNDHLGTFVTLTQPGHRVGKADESYRVGKADEIGPGGDWSEHNLRGCIGTLTDSRPVIESVPANAISAAFRDPRFPPLDPRELPDTRFEVSVLSAPEPMDVHSEAEALAALRPGVDGVILSDGFRQATFLPQVWDELPDPRVFLQHLRGKAGLPANYWGPNTRLQRYTVQAWEEPIVNGRLEPVGSGAGLGLSDGSD